jgi:hypothetical protein
MMSLYLFFVLIVFLSLFQLILCIAGVCRALVGVSGGATRTAITQHQARANNISDVAAKDGSQETLVRTPNF